MEESEEVTVLWKELMVGFKGKIQDPLNFKRWYKKCDSVLYFFAYSNDKLIGMSVAKSKGKQAWVGWTTVKPEYRKKGIASYLIKKALAHLFDKGYRNIFAQTNWLEGEMLLRSVGFD